MSVREYDAIVEGEGIEGEGVTRLTMKRRGLIAGAATLVAGIIATRASQPEPVAAGSGDTFVVGRDNFANTRTTLLATETYGGFQVIYTDDSGLRVDPGVLSDHYFNDPSKPLYNIDGIQGRGKGTFTGVVGDGGNNNGLGVLGRGVGTAAGVLGFGGNQLGAPGVVGLGNNASANNGDGVRGFGVNGGVGVAGHGGDTNATGVIGYGGGTSGQGVAGIGSGGTGPGVVGVGGNFVATNNADGVQGFANGTGNGVTGHGGGSNGTGLLGFGGGT
ncbi:MAG: hypothetical protein LC793_01540, partial [Thermomicrobia bacterium]|nr:hypothetical protein [Thermomicrobia bacterium]